VWWLVAGAAVVLAAGGAYLALGGGSTGTTEGLPRTPDYHSLLVAPADPQTLLLGTHTGLHRSADGGRTWNAYTLPGQDAMNLKRTSGGTIWAAGHLVFAKSEDGGETWTDVRPDTLPNLDLHGFAVDPSDPDTLYAAAAGAGLYRSRDAGATFELVSGEVGGSVFGLAVTPDGRILAGDGGRGLLESRDGGTTWREALPAAIAGVAVNPKDPQRVLATGPGVYLSTDGGATWRRVLEVEDGAGPVAWAASAPGTAYVVGFDRTLHKTTDGGETWNPVA
jgi:photosystem II stability/assembly factor-like uncharacterized protein